MDPENIAELGLQKYVEYQNKRYSCPECGGPVHWYHYKCSNCGQNVLIV